MIDFSFGNQVMGGWKDCTSKYKYARVIEDIIRAHVAPGGRVLMLGLGGGCLCGLLDDYDLTVVEIDSAVHMRAKRLFYGHMEACARQPRKANIIIHDAHTVPVQMTGTNFAALIVDIPSCYEHGDPIGLTNCLDRVEHLVVCNYFQRSFHKKMLASSARLEDYGLTRADNNYIGVLTKIWKAETRVSRMQEDSDVGAVHPLTCRMPRIRFSEQHDSNDNGCAIHAVQHLLLLNDIRARIDHKAVWRTAATEGVIIDGGIPISDVHRCLDAKIHEMVRRRGMVFKSLNALR